MKYIIESGGKQYIAEQGKTLVLSKIKGKVGSVINLKVISTLQDQKLNTNVTTIQGEIKQQKRDKKNIVFKKIRRHNYEKKIGHRSYITLVSVL